MDQKSKDFVLENEITNDQSSVSPQTQGPGDIGDAIAVSMPVSGGTASDNGDLDQKSIVPAFTIVPDNDATKDQSGPTEESKDPRVSNVDAPKILTDSGRLIRKHDDDAGADGGSRQRNRQRPSEACADRIPSSCVSNRNQPGP